MINAQIRPARRAEAKLCRMLLGNETSVHPNYHLFLALDDSERPLGAGIVRSGVEAAGEFWGVHLATIPAFCDSGVEAKLLEYAQAYGATHGATLLQTLRWFEQGSQAEQEWSSLGFAPKMVRYAHETEVGRAFARLTPLFQEVVDHGWIPPDARIIPLAEADLQKVCELHVQYLGSSVRQLLPLLNGTAPNSYDPQASVVLLCGAQTMGFTLGWFPEPTMCEISANVLHPSVRFGWANLLLKYHALQCVMARGATMFRYTTMENHTDSRRAYRWVGGGTARVEVCLQISCPPAHVTTP